MLQPHPLGLSCAAADLWEQQIDTERCVLVLQIRLELCNLLPEHVWSVADTADDAQSACIGHGGSELWTSGNVHTGQEDWMLDSKQIRRDGLELFCIVVLA